MEDVSITGLFCELCTLHSQQKKRAYITQPEHNRSYICSRLKRRLYNTLFQYLKGPQRLHALERSKSCTENEVIRFMSIAYQLRCDRKFDEANRLEHLLYTLLPDDTAVAANPDLCSVLQFLLCLAGTGTGGKSGVIGHGQQKLPVWQTESTGILPDGPLWYGDSQVCRPQHNYYMHYSRDIFEAKPLESDEKDCSIFDMTPGSGLSGSGFFNIKGYLDDKHEHNTSASLFGALVQGKVSSVDVKLDLPELPEEMDMRLIEPRIPKFDSLSQVSEDEGFIETDPSLTSSVSTDSAIEEDIWDLALKHEPSQHYTWETIGCGPGPKEKPFLSEAGPKALDELYNTTLKELSTLCPNVVIPDRVAVSPRAFVADVINLLIGVPSSTFMLDLTDQCFSQREGVYVSGMTPEGLQEFTQDFMECGMHYYRLVQFSYAPVLDSFYGAGLVFQAFAGAIRKVLQHYRAVVLSVPKDKTLCEVKFLLHRIFSQMRYLSSLCHCTNPVLKSSVPGQPGFPTGVALLSYLYRETMEAACTDHYPLMLSILQTACGPYLVFVQDWVYNGIYRDTYGEFMIQVHDDYLLFRNKHYWTNGYTLSTNKMEDSVPLFLQDLAREIFICGKSVNLLKTIAPQHFMCQVSDLDIPRVTLTFSEEELSFQNKQCQMYTSKMQQIARQLTMTRKEMKEREEQAKRDLIHKAKEAAAQEMARLQAKIMEAKKAVDMKKKREFEFLKSQMQTDLQRRASEKKEEKKSDKEYMDRVMRKEEVMSKEDLDLERRAREELVEYYSSLTAEAAAREQKALWKVRRARLHLDREKFLKEDSDRWDTEMDAFEKGQIESKLDFHETTLPKWAQRVKSATGPIVVGDDGDSDLPSWAQRGQNSPTVVVGDEETSNKDLPAWARKGLMKYGLKVRPSSSLSEEELSPSKSPRASSVGGTLTGTSSPSKTVLQMKSGSLNTSLVAETDKPDHVSSIQVFPHVHASMETEGDSQVKSAIKLVEDKHATAESQQEETIRPHIKSVDQMSATKMSDPQPEIRPHLKSVHEQHANKESEKSDENKQFPHLKRRDDLHATTETQAEEWKLKQANPFGHVSEKSNSEFDILAPRMKKSALMFASKESDFKDFAIKSRIRFTKGRSASTESEPPGEKVRPRIKMSGKMSATKESEFVDMDEMKLRKFKQMNIHGHSSDSTVQKLLYREEQTEPQDVSEFVTVIPKPDPSQWILPEVEQYQDDFDFLSNPPAVDLISSTLELSYGGLGDYGISLRPDVEGYKYLSLPTLIKRSITAPLAAQISLINESLVNYFLVDLNIEQHFQALYRYLCMADGDFSEILSDQLFEKLATNPRPQEVLNHVFLNRILTKAVRSCINADDKYSDNLSFAVKFTPKVFQQSAHDTDCLDLNYTVEWPLNIVITEACMDKYSQIFSFMLQLKRIVWALKDIWHRLKRDALIHKAGNTTQFRQLQLHRQEMEHFVKVLQGYLANQIVHVTWQEFQESLSHDVHNLDDLHSVHVQYLDKAIFRCLLNKKARPLMKIIWNIFGLILKFRGQLIAGEWRTDPKSKATTHRNFANMVVSYKSFQEYSVFLFRVVNKLAMRGYQPHLQELLLRLNFNHYYPEK